MSLNKYVIECMFKDGLSLKIKIHINLYFIATKYL